MEVDVQEQSVEENKLTNDIKASTSNTIKEKELIDTTDLSKDAGDTLQARRKIIFLLQLNLLNFQRAILMSRRRCQQRIQRRRRLITSAYIRQLLDIQNSYIQLMPKLHLSYKRSKEHKEENNGSITDSSEEEHDDEDKSADFEDEDDENCNELTPPRRLCYYDDSVLKFNDEEWLSTFRVSKATYDWLCTELNDALKASGASVPLKNLISVEKRVALVLYAFATGADYRIIAELFGVSRTSVCKFIKRFADSVIEVFGKKQIALPTILSEYDEIRRKFQLVSNMPPLVVGVLGECELPVNPPADDLSTYYNDAGNPTLCMQTLVDDKLMFRHVSIEAISQSQPAMLLDREITKLPMHVINGVEVSCFIVAPSTNYPLRNWLMTSYSVPINPHEHDFNDAIDQLLEIKDKALRRLFARWHILERKCDLEPKTMEAIAMACCVLHNLLEEREETFLQEWGSTVNFTKLIRVTRQQKLKRDSNTAMQMREHLARTISSTEM